MSERDLISWIRERLVASEHVVLHSGDDLSVLRLPDGVLAAFGIDTIVSGIDFMGPGSDRPTPARAVGRKALAVNLSDLAAMGARPLACVVSVTIPPGTDPQYPRDLYEGMRGISARFGMPVVGGDVTAAGGPLSLSVAVLGSYDKSDGPLLRAAARPGDALYVTGPLGGSLLGKHLEFEPAVEAGRYLARSGVRIACIDISDGLSTDAGRLAQESEVRVIIEDAAVPVSDAARELSARDGRAPLEHALDDGEDFELLFTVPADDAGGRAVIADWPAGPARPVRIGRIEEGEPAVLLEGGGRTFPLEPGGYEHQF